MECTKQSRLWQVNDSSLKKLIITIVALFSFISPFSMAADLINRCVDKRDTYFGYDNRVAKYEVNDLPSQYYVLSYSWSAHHCNNANYRSKKAGGKNYLQCTKPQQFNYILHGLWPQGSLRSGAKYPRACGGDQPKIARTVLEPYLCMTPSVWLLQHEYEYHGTCMPNKELQSPKGYFDMARSLHNQLTLPSVERAYNETSWRWFYKNNPHLVNGAIQYWHKAGEWQFCYDQKFQSMRCPRTKTVIANFPTKVIIAKKVLNTVLEPAVEEKKPIKRAILTLKPKSVITPKFKQPVKKGCVVKGNISKKKGKKLYFIPSHSQYFAVKIVPEQGERCFSSAQEAEAAGWKPAQ